MTKQKIRELISNDIIGKQLTDYSLKGKKTGIYFLLQNDIVVYVGKALNIFSRIRQHLKSDKIFNKVYYLEFQEEELYAKENEFISKFVPLYNKDNLSKIIKSWKVKKKLIRLELSKITTQDNILKDLLFWSKIYLSEKLQSNHNELKQNLLDAKTFIELENISIKCRRTTFRSFGNFSVPIIDFTYYIIYKRVYHFKNIDTNLLSSHIKLNLKDFKKDSIKHYYYQIKDFFDFIDVNNFQFNIGYLKDGTKAKRPF
jgi:hypothetical protein